MFKCPRCGGDTKVVQTINGSTKQTLPAKFDNTGKVIETAEATMPMVTRKLKCKECYHLFFTTELFSKWTEESIKQGIDERDIVMSQQIATKVVEKHVTRGLDWDYIRKQYAGVDTSQVNVINPEESL